MLIKVSLAIRETFLVNDWLLVEIVDAAGAVIRRGGIDVLDGPLLLLEGRTDSYLGVFLGLAARAPR